MECGHLERVEAPDGKSHGYDGEIALAGVPFNTIGLRPVPVKRSKDSPDFHILTSDRRGFPQVGAAWLKDFKDGSGQFLSITFDAPDMAKRVNVAAFPDEEQPKEAEHDVLFTVKWSRPRPGAKRSAAPDAAEGLASDGIPF